MAMRPEVRRHSLVIIAFALIQWGFVQYILHEQLFGLVTNQRILLFCSSSFLGALLIFAALIYLVLKGNNPDE